VRQARALLVPVPVLLMSSISYHVSPASAILHAWTKLSPSEYVHEYESCMYGHTYKHV
jgi:hypothetical protein